MILIFSFFSYAGEDYKSTDNQGMNKYERINSIEGFLQKLSKEIASMQKSLKDIDMKKIKNLQGEIKKLKEKDIKELRKLMAEFDNNKIEEIKKGVETNKGNIGDNSQEIKKINTEIDLQKLKQEVGFLKSAIKNLQGAIETMQSIDRNTP